MLRLTQAVFPKEDLHLFRILSTIVKLLPERLELMPENDLEDQVLYDGDTYSKMFLRALGIEFGLEMSQVLIGMWSSDTRTSFPIYSLVLPGGSRFILGIPGTLGTGPALFHEFGTIGVVCRPTLFDETYWEKEPHWFKRSVGLFREAIQARASSSSGPQEQTQPI